MLSVSTYLHEIVSYVSFLLIIIFYSHFSIKYSSELCDFFNCSCFYFPCHDCCRHFYMEIIYSPYTAIRSISLILFLMNLHCCCLVKNAHMVPNHIWHWLIIFLMLLLSCSAHLLNHVSRLWLRFSLLLLFCDEIKIFKEKCIKWIGVYHKIEFEQLFLHKQGR